jgi:hypothetical protein
MLPAIHTIGKGTIMKYFLVTFPSDATHLIAMRISMRHVYNDTIVAPYYREIDALEITEHFIINNRYLVVRIR